ncbi:MAG TPA: acylphosphatase [Kiritimatiellia bacterium]|nr:acylphosphatase [Kiritimatiellia bacterium]
MTKKKGPVQATTRRMNVIFEGHVQGVGFRFTTVDVARGMRVKGYVQNLPDGDVRLVAEGAESELFRLLAGIKGSAVGRFIRSERVNWSTATGEFDTFGIRYG